MAVARELVAIKGLIGEGRLDEAAERCRGVAESGRALDHEDEAELIYLLAVITGETGAFQESLPLYDRARRMMPARSGWRRSSSFHARLDT